MVHSHFINTNREMHKNTQKYTNTCTIQSSLSISISENIRLKPVIKIKASHENSNKPRDMPADVDLFQDLSFLKSNWSSLQGSSPLSCRNNFKMNRLSQILMNSTRRDGTHRNLMISWKLAALCLYFVSLWHCYLNLQEKILSKSK